MNRILTTSLIAASAAALVAGTCAPALADTPTPAPTPHSGRTLAAIQAAAKVKTSDRITKLNAAIARANSAKGLTDSDKATILATFNADIAGMNTVEAKIQADTDAQTAAADFKTIFTTYRVYAVALPQARIAGAADRMTTVAIPRLNTAESKLSGLLSGKDSGKSTPALQADLADMQAKIAAATSALNGVAAGALAVTPADFNANHDALSGERASVKTAVADLKAAETDAKTIRAALK